MINYSPELKTKILAYYEKYYQDCGLKDFQQRAQERLGEEEAESKKIKRLLGILNFDFQNQKHFICGAGTAGLAVVLAKEYNCEVFGIEPDKQEFEIIQQKCQEAGILSENFKKEFGEQMSFQSSQFDFIHCFMVLEHVANVEKCLSEMIRITKPGGIVYIATPNYAFPAERHYKIFFPTFLPKFFGKIYLRLRNKPAKFLDTLNFLTEKKLNRILLRQKGIIWLRVYQAGIQEDMARKKLFQFLLTKFFIYPNQEVIIQKLF